jgi:hypothetical protein
MWKEVVPFWSLTFLGLALSTWTADFADTWGIKHFDSHLLRTLTVAAASLGAFGILWIVKFIIFNKLMFVDHDAES